MATLNWKRGLGMLMLAGCGSVASAQAHDGAFMALGARMEAPKGFVVMCSSDATFCAKPANADADGGDARLITGALAEGAPVARLSAVRFFHVGQFSRRPVSGGPTPSKPLPLAAQQEMWLAGGRAGKASFGVSTSAHASLMADGLTRIDLKSTAIASAFLLRHGGSSEDVIATPSPVALSNAGTGPEKAVAIRDVPKAEALLRRVNEYVNARVAQKTDRQVYGRDEVWQRSGVGHRAAGDCEDIAIEKRYQLIDAGFPPEQLYFAVVYGRQVGLHAVLIARAVDGDYVLDSRSPYVKPWDQTNYTFVSIQSPLEPMQWHALSEESLHFAQQVDGLTPKAS